jgi:hypothetical protein
VINYATDQSTHAKAVVVGKLLVSVTSMHKKMIESISLQVDSNNSCLSLV